MRKLVYYVGTSLDGYIAGPDGEFDFYPLSQELAAWINARYPETVPTHLRAAAGIAEAANQRFDTVLMGLGTYRPAYDHGITQPYAHLRQIVVSSTLVPADPAVEVVAADPVQRVRDLKAEDGGDVWLCGGGVLPGALMPEIDEVVVKRYPVLAGAGRPMVVGAFDPTAFRVDDEVSFDDGAHVTTLRRTRPHDGRAR